MIAQFLPYRYIPNHLPHLLRQSLLTLVVLLFSPLAALAASATETAGTQAATQAASQAARTAPSSGVELVMVEQQGCEWCRRWNEEIAPIYPKTTEGAFAPLRRVDLRAIPDDLKTARRVNFTPTFLIVKDSHEMARLEGYPGEDFFWPLLAQLLSKHVGFTPDTAESPGS